MFVFKKLEAEDSPSFRGLYSRACNSQTIQVVIIQASDVVENFGTPGEMGGDKGSGGNKF